jgi:hypothetical protein
VTAANRKEPVKTCKDFISTDDITFPAYKNADNKQCYNRDTMLQFIKYRGSDGFSRDPATRFRLNLPEDLANLNMERAVVADEEVEEFDWSHWQQDLFPDDEEDSDFEENGEVEGAETNEEAAIRAIEEGDEMEEFDEDVFPIDYIVQLIGDFGNPEYAGEVYHLTKHRVRDFDTVMITKLWELGMHVEAQDLYARTIEMTPDWYSQSSIEDLKRAGMEEQAWQLHILKARWLPKGEYPVDMINHYLRQHMHRLAVSLHDRTISVLYDKHMIWMTSLYVWYQ